MDLLYWIAGIIAFLLVTTYIIKKLTKAQTVAYIISIVKTKRFNKSLDNLAKHTKFLNLFADLGLILSFGALAVDYRYGRKRSPLVRIALFLATTAVLYVLLDYVLVVDILNANSPIAEFNEVIRISFALFGLSGLMLVFLIAYSWYVIQGLLIGKQVCPGIAPLIPGTEIPKIKLFVPLHAWISFVVIMILHEGMHGVFTRKAKVKLKSVGVLLAGLIPVGAFVEPDEKALRKKSGEDQLRVYVAGPVSNLYTSLIVSVLLGLVISFVVLPAYGPLIKEVRDNSVTGILIGSIPETIDLCGEPYENDAFGKLKPGMRILAINDRNVGNLAEVISLPNFGKTLGNQDNITYVNKDVPITMKLLLDGEEVSFELEPNKIGMIRFGYEEEKNPNYVIPQEYTDFVTWYNFFSDFVFWFILLNVLVALANLLPNEPFDGGKITKILLLPYFGFMKMSKEDTEKLIGRLFLWIVGILILINAIPLFL